MERYFDFQRAEGLQLNLLGREFNFLHFPGAESVNREYESLKSDMRTYERVFRTSSVAPRGKKEGKEGKDGKDKEKRETKKEAKVGGRAHGTEDWTRPSPTSRGSAGL